MTKLAVTRSPTVQPETCFALFPVRLFLPGPIRVETVGILAGTLSGKLHLSVEEKGGNEKQR